MLDPQYAIKSVHGVMELITLAISVLGAVVVIWGIVEAMAGFLTLKFTQKADEQIAVGEKLRQRLGAHLLLGLEIFIGADIISSFVSPNWNKVGILAVIVAIRTVLSYFLGREVKAAK
jgi:uncharacterized membrane protein